MAAGQVSSKLALVLLHFGPKSRSDDGFDLPNGSIFGHLSLILALEIFRKIDFHLPLDFLPVIISSRADFYVVSMGHFALGGWVFVHTCGSLEGVQSLHCQASWSHQSDVGKKISQWKCQVASFYLKELSNPRLDGCSSEWCLLQEWWSWPLNVQHGGTWLPFHYTMNLNAFQPHWHGQPSSCLNFFTN